MSVSRDWCATAFLGRVVAPFGARSACAREPMTATQGLVTATQKPEQVATPWACRSLRPLASSGERGESKEFARSVGHG